MKNVLISFIGLLGFVGVLQANPTVESDSIVINYGEGSKIVIYIANGKDASTLSEVDFNKIMASVSSYLDSVKNEGGGTFMINDDLASYKIVAEQNVKDDDEPIGLVNNIINKRWSDYDNNDDNYSNRWRKKEKRNKKTKQTFGIELGVNFFLENDKIPTGTNYELRPLGSRYVALDWRYKSKITKNVRLNYGVNISWYNFMFDGKRKIVVDTNDAVSFLKDDKSLSKSKLTASFINLPLMLQFGTNDFRLAFGGYVGYRLASHSKVKYKGERKAEKEFNNFNLTNFRYGLKAELGIRNATIFATYDMNSLFIENNNLPELTAFSFGFRL